MKEYSKGIYVKFKPEEVEILHNRMKEAGVQNMSAYIRKMALNGYIIEMDLSGVKEMIRLLRINANNLNQYARRANECGSVYSEDIKNLQEQQKGLWKEMRKVLEMLSKLEET